jgi:hypothetical protein
MLRSPSTTLLQLYKLQGVKHLREDIYKISERLAERENFRDLDVDGKWILSN